MADTEHGRLAWWTPDELDPARRAVYDAIAGGPRAGAQPAFGLTDSAGRLEGPFNAMLINPELGDALQRLGSAIRYQGTLPDRGRELAILTLAVERDSDFEWYAHERVGRRVGLTEDELAAVRAGIDVGSFSPEERLVRRAVLALCRERDLDEELHAALIEAIGRAQLDELVTLTGYYDLLALSLKVWRTPLPEGEVASFQPTASTAHSTDPGSNDGHS
ncbi:MAG: carboxymuconolactone decarboxylase family protein [Jatrophihabitantaceae bacterium]